MCGCFYGLQSGKACDLSCETPAFQNFSRPQAAHVVFREFAQRDVRPSVVDEQASLSSRIAEQYLFAVCH
jgi:hypothetical protein